MSWICIVETPSGELIPMMKDDTALAQWPTEDEAREATKEMLIVQSYGAEYVEV